MLELVGDGSSGAEYSGTVDHCCLSDIPVNAKTADGRDVAAVD